MSKQPAPTLPRPNVSVGISRGMTGKHNVDVNISRDGVGRGYRGRGSSESEAVVDVVRKILDDRSTGEWLP